MNADEFIADCRRKGIAITEGKPAGSMLAGAGNSATPPKKPRKRRTFATARPATWVLILRPACRVVSEANEREHWAVKNPRRKTQKAAVLAALERQPVDFDVLNSPLIVTFTHLGRRMDDDNLAGAFKACRDALARYVGMDDGDEGWTWKYEQRLATKPAEYGIEVRIEPRV